VQAKLPTYEGRQGREAGKITLSVVIAALNGAGSLHDTLTALSQQQLAPLHEIIVAVGEDPQVVELARSRFPSVTLLERPLGQTLGQLRAAGVQQAQGAIIALTEDHCIPAPDWLERIASSHSAYPQVAAIGGAVDNAAGERLVDWVAFGVEYSRFATPLDGERNLARREAVTVLAAANVSYKRSALWAYRDSWRDAFWEGSFHRQLRADGRELLFDPTLRVWHKKRFRLRAYLRERYYYSRWFAGSRARAVPAARRLLYTALTPLLPLLMSLRIVRSWWGKPGPFWRALPLVFLAALVAAWGELVGNISGPGSSAELLR